MDKYLELSNEIYAGEAVRIILEEIEFMKDKTCWKFFFVERDLVKRVVEKLEEKGFRVEISVFGITVFW